MRSNSSQDYRGVQKTPSILYKQYKFEYKECHWKLFFKLSDKPLVYKKTDDGFILYSIGEDFKDDGGQIARDDEGKIKRYADEGDWVFWPVMGK